MIFMFNFASLNVPPLVGVPVRAHNSIHCPLASPRSQRLPPQFPSKKVALWKKGFSQPLSEGH